MDERRSVQDLVDMGDRLRDSADRVTPDLFLPVCSLKSSREARLQV